MALVLVTPPAAEPVTLDEAKAQCRIDGADEDLLITSLIRTARTKVENLTNRALLPQTWDLVLDGWPDGAALEIPLPPLQSVASITYLDSAGALQTLAPASYRLAKASTPGRVVLARDASWPADLLDGPESITVRFVAGYADAAGVPEPLKLAIKLLVGHWYENREEVSVGAGLSLAEIPFGVQVLTADYRVWSF